MILERGLFGETLLFRRESATIKGHSQINALSRSFTVASTITEQLLLSAAWDLFSFDSLHGKFTLISVASR